MLKRVVSQWRWVVAGIGLIACTPRVSVPGDGPGQSNEAHTPATSGDAPTASEIDCAALCETVSEGSCLDHPGSAPMCELECVRVLTDQSPRARAPFAECVATNPLCYVSVEMCIMDSLHPEPFAHTVRYTGYGYDRFEGMTVHAGLRGGDGAIQRADAVVADGGFTVSFDVILPVSATRLVLLYVDTDGDGVCTPDVDFGDSEFAAISGPLDAPRFEAGGPPPDASRDHVCNHL